MATRKNNRGFDWEQLNQEDTTIVVAFGAQGACKTTSLLALDLHFVENYNVIHNIFDNQSGMAYFGKLREGFQKGELPEITNTDTIQNYDISIKTHKNENRRFHFIEASGEKFANIDPTKEQFHDAFVKSFVDFLKNTRNPVVFIITIDFDRIVTNSYLNLLLAIRALVEGINPDFFYNTLLLVTKWDKFHHSKYSNQYSSLEEFLENEAMPLFNIMQNNHQSQMLPFSIGEVQIEEDESGQRGEIWKVKGGKPDLTDCEDIAHWLLEEIWESY